MMAGLTLAGVSPASAESTGGLRCGYGFCYSVVDIEGGRYLTVSLDPGNNPNMCATVYKWDRGEQTAISGTFGPMPGHPVVFSAAPYSVYQDATVDVDWCNGFGRWFRFKIGAWTSPNGFV